MLFFFASCRVFVFLPIRTSFFFVQQSNSPTNLPIEISKRLIIRHLQNPACRTVRIRLLVLLDGRWKAPFQQKNNLRPTKTPTKPTTSNNVQQIYKQYNYLTTNYLLPLIIEQIGDFRAKLDCWTYFSGVSLFKMCLIRAFCIKRVRGISAFWAHEEKKCPPSEPASKKKCPAVNETARLSGARCFVD